MVCSDIYQAVHAARPQDVDLLRRRTRYRFHSRVGATRSFDPQELSRTQAFQRPVQTSHGGARHYRRLDGHRDVRTRRICRSYHRTFWPRPSQAGARRLGRWRHSGQRLETDPVHDLDHHQRFRGHSRRHPFCIANPRRIADQDVPVRRGAACHARYHRCNSSDLHRLDGLICHSRYRRSARCPADVGPDGQRVQSGTFSAGLCDGHVAEPLRGSGPDGLLRADRSYRRRKCEGGHQ